MNNARGQILLPGLGVYLLLLAFFFCLVLMGWRILLQMRLETTAQAAALSAARAMALELNDCARHNLDANALVTRTGDAAVTDEIRFLPFELWYWAYEARSLANGAGSLFGGLNSFPARVGNEVAQENGAQGKSHWPQPWRTQLSSQDLDVVVVGDPPFTEEFSSVYFTRDWQSAQPPHQVTWLVSKDGLKASATARVYLDVNKEANQNGGFPRTGGEEPEDLIGIQSFWPQFNARLVLTSAITSGALNLVSNLGGGR
jgi:hypothetical protein